jgi:putative membrane protein
MIQITLAALHLIALGLGLGAVINRGTALREVPDLRSVQRVFRADTLWALAAGLWIATGLWRYLGEMEKGVEYYNANYFFLTKMTLLGVILLLEIWPMVTLIRWRLAISRGGSPGVVAVPGTARIVATISHVQALLVVLMVFAAAAMARGYNLT